MPQREFLHVWRDAVLSKDGPQHPAGRLVLTTLAQHMRLDGTGAWPSEMLLAQRTGLSLRTVIRHLAEVDKTGWINRKRVPVAGKRFHRYEYMAALPKELRAKLACGTPNNVPSVRNEVPTATEQHAKNDSINVPQRHTNSPSNSPFNYPTKREEGFSNVGKKDEERAEEMRQRLSVITDLLGKGYGAGDIAKLLRVRGVTLAEAQQVEASLRTKAGLRVARA